MEEDESLLSFPCRYSVKAIGRADTEIEAAVVDIVRRHAPYLPEGAVRSRPSRGNRYLAVTVTFEARDRAQLDAIYRALTDHDLVLLSL